MKHRQGANNHYFGNLWEGIKTSLTGLHLSIKHAWEARHRRKPLYVQDDDYFVQKKGIVTLQYPLESIPAPDHARYRLHNEMDDCIVCDKCAKICPVDCIEIEPIRASEQIGTASDGSPIRLYAAKFDIDMAKCCYCGLCTTVCPTECLTMTKAYDYSEDNVRDMIYHFANLSPEEAEEKVKLWNQYQAEKEALKAQKAESQDIPAPKKSSGGFKPTFKPKLPQKKSDISLPETSSETDKKPAAPKPRPSFKPKMKPKPSPGSPKPESSEQASKPDPKPRPKFKPKIAGKPSQELPKTDKPEENTSPSPKTRPKFRPKIKGNIKPKNDSDTNQAEEN